MQGNQDPMSTGVATNPQLAQSGIDSQIKQYKNEERLNYAKPILPYPLDQIPNVLDRIRTPLLNLGTMLIQAQQNPQITDNYNLTGFSNILDRVDKLNNDIIDLQRSVDKLSI